MLLWKILRIFPAVLRLISTGAMVLQCFYSFCFLPTFYPCNHSDTEQLSQYLNFQITELMNWRGGCSNGIAIKGSQHWSIVGQQTFADICPSFILPPFSPLFLFSQRFQAISLNFSFSFSPFPYTSPWELFCFPTIPISLPILYLTPVHRFSWFI